MTGMLLFTALVILLALALIPAHRRAQQRPPHRTGWPSDVDDLRVEQELREAAQRDLDRSISSR
jgi:hypothetical protein